MPIVKQYRKPFSPYPFRNSKEGDRVAIYFNFGHKREHRTRGTLVRISTKMAIIKPDNGRTMHFWLHNGKSTSFDGRFLECEPLS